MSDKPRIKAPQYSEAQLHKAVAQYLDLAIKWPAFWTTFPAGGGGKARGGKLRTLGLKRGVPDILIFGPYRPPPHRPEGTLVLGVELKSSTGSVSEDQKRMIATFEHLGARMFICRSVEDVERVVGFSFDLHATLMPGGGIKLKAAA